MLGLFTIGALVPIITLSVLSYLLVADQLRSQAQEQIQRANRNGGVTILERLRYLESDLRSIGRQHVLGTLTGLDTAIVTRFIHIAIDGHSRRTLTTGAPPPVISFTDTQQDWLRRERPLILLHASGSSTSIWMAQPFAEGIVWGEISKIHLFDGLQGNDDNLVCVFSARENIGCQTPFAEQIREQVRGARATRPSAPSDRIFPLNLDGEQFVAAYWTLFVRSGYHAEDWIIVHGEPRAAVFRPLKRFNQLFPFMIIATIAGVVLLTHIQIRLSMAPLTALSDGTRRVGRGDYQTPVTVTSGDEFEDLAHSFNKMSAEINRNVKALVTSNNIDRAVLSELQTDRIVETVMARSQDVLGWDEIVIGLRGADDLQRWRGFTTHPDRQNPTETHVVISSQTLRTLQHNPEFIQVARGAKRPDFVLDVNPETESCHLLMLPILSKQQVEGALVFGYRGGLPRDPDTLRLARHFADQVAVAHSNSRLVEELDHLNWGTLQALARAIDAKSPWTSGHSERVTSLALALGKHVGLNTTDLELLRRGGLLHDVGKIGVSASILDKGGKLSEAEWIAMQAHTTIGVRILEPISSYRSIISLVRSHHEKMDGTGYPDGLVGQNIPPLARLLAVADVYDALTSERPYRQAMSKQQALHIIAETAGTHFDERFVTAFIDLMGDDENNEQYLVATNAGRAHA